MTSIEHFANQHRLRIKRDEVKDLIIPGRLGHLYEHDGGILSLMLASPNGDDPRLDSTLRSRKRKALAEGLELHQEGDYESTFTFNPENKQHARLAIRLASIKRRRRQTGKGKPFTSERVRELAQIRHGCAGEGHEEPQSEPIPVLAGSIGRRTGSEH